MAARNDDHSHENGDGDGDGRLELLEVPNAQWLLARRRSELALRESEGRHRFLAELANAVQPLADPIEVMQLSARLLAEYLRVDRCAYAEIEDESTFVITGDHPVGVPSIVGHWPVAAFGAECLRLMRANEPFVVDDVDSDPRIGEAELPAFRATAIQAVICVPLHKAGKFTAAMAVHYKRPRRWTTAEIELVTTVVGRCWESLERARVTRTLRESEALYRAIVEASPDCVKVVSAAGILLQMNPAGLAMVEADTPGEIIGHSIFSVIAPEHHEAFRELHARVCRGEPSTLRFELIGRKGTRRHMETSAVPLPSMGGGYSHLAVTRDITMRVAVERQLQESQTRLRRTAEAAARAAEANAKFRAFFEQGTNFAGVLSLDGAVVEANRLCLEACGFTREEVIGRPFWECGWWSRSSELKTMIRSACMHAAAGQIFRTETPYFVAAGEERIVDLILAPVTDDAERVLFLAASGTDVTNRRQMEDSLRAADRKKDEFIALLAHELRNPLAPIRNGLQILRLGGEDAATADRARAMMDRQLSHMVRLIDDLLDVSRINRKRMELRRARVLLADIVNSAVETARPLIDAEHHELTVSLPPEPIYLDADLTRLAQVFSNLLTNSAKYTERGGRIWLTARQQLEGRVAISVRDTGIGIPVESLATIFDMFAQLDRPMERATGGLGIGLALVKGLVEMHGGTVTAESPGQGQGSTFTVTLPVLAAPESLDPPGPSSNPTPSPQRRRILVVDDNRDGADSLAMMLRLLGNDVAIANDGLEAIERAEELRPHVIFMDLGMPALDGYEATRRIRERPWGGAVTIIALTGWGQESDRARSQAAGCNGHFVKPVSLGDLQRLLATVAPQ